MPGGFLESSNVLHVVRYFLIVAKRLIEGTLEKGGVVLLASNSTFKTKVTFILVQLYS